MVALVATVALGAVGVSSAYASTPEFKGAIGTTFTGTAGKVLLETTTHAFVTCKATSAYGGTLASSTTLTKVTFLFTGCEQEATACTTTGKSSGQVATSELTGQLGYINKTAKSAGLELKPTAGASVAEFKCRNGSLKFKVTGAVIGAITPTKVFTTKFTVEFKESAGKQAVLNFEGGPETVLLLETENASKEKSALFHSGLEMTDQLTFGKEIEIVA